MRYIATPTRAEAPLASSACPATDGSALVAATGCTNTLPAHLGAALCAAIALSTVTPTADVRGSPATGAVEAAVALEISRDPDLPPRGAGRREPAARYSVRGSAHATIQPAERVSVVRSALPFGLGPRGRTPLYQLRRTSVTSSPCSAHGREPEPPNARAREPETGRPSREEPC